MKVGVDGVQRHTGSAVAERAEQAVGPDLVSDSTKAEDGHLEAACVVEEEVLGLEAMVEDTTGVAVADGKDHWEVLREAAPGDFGEELATLGELHDNLDLGTGGEDLEQGDDGGIHGKNKNLMSNCHIRSLTVIIGWKANRGQSWVKRENW